MIEELEEFYSGLEEKAADALAGLAAPPGESDRGADRHVICGDRATEIVRHAGSLYTSDVPVHLLRVGLLLAAALAVGPAAPWGSWYGDGPAARAQDVREERDRMVREQLAAEGPFRAAITDSAVLGAMRAVPRHRFVPSRLRGAAYEDRPLPIGHGQTISQPWIVARMTELARPEPGDTVLEVGTGSGYQAAVLAEVTDHVFTIEIIGELARSARRRLRELGYGNVTVRHGDGYRGWPECAPFDAIVVTAAPEQIPEPLVEQLARGGRMVIPVGPRGGGQALTVLHREADGTVEQRVVSAVRFVPMTRDTGGGG